MEKENSTFREKTDNEPRSIKKIAITIIFIGIAIASPFLVYWILQIALNTTSPITVVISGSMEPNYYKGDLLFLYGEDPANIEINEVIVFQTASYSEPIVHRVIEKRYVGEYQFKTKGDANTFEDSGNLYTGWLSEEDVIGTVVGRIPFIGWVKIFFTEGKLLLPLIILIIIVLIISIVWDVVKKEVEGGETDKHETEGENNPP